MESFISKFISAILIILVFKFMSKKQKNEDIIDSDIIIFQPKKNAKIISYIMCFILIIIFPLVSLKTIIKDKETALLIVNLISIFFGVCLLLATKYDVTTYENGVFKKKNIFGKTKVYQFTDVVKAKYINNDVAGSITLYFKNKKKLEFNSFETNCNWLLNELEKRNIDICNK